MNTILRPLFALTLLLSLTACGGESYELGSLDPEVGQAVATTTEFIGENGVISVIVNGEVVSEGTMDNSTSETEHKTITKIVDGEVTEYTTRITASKDVSKSSMNGEETNEQTSSPLLRETVTWKLEGDEYIPELANATAAQLEELKPEPNDDFDVYPEEPVKIGDSWELSREALASFTDQTIEGDFEGEGIYELVGIEDYEGEQCAKLKVTLVVSSAMPEDELEEGMESGRVSMKMEGVIYRSLESRLDIHGELKGSSTVHLNGPGYTIRVESGLTIIGSDQLIEE